MNIWSQFFPERSACGLDFFTDGSIGKEVTKNSYQPSIKIVVSFGAFKTAFGPCHHFMPLIKSVEKFRLSLIKDISNNLSVCTSTSGNLIKNFNHSNLTYHPFHDFIFIFRAEHEIYIGNYPASYREDNIKNLFKKYDIEVGKIRMKSDGQKV